MFFVDQTLCCEGASLQGVAWLPLLDPTLSGGLQTNGKHLD